MSKMMSTDGLTAISVPPQMVEKMNGQLDKLKDWMNETIETLETDAEEKGVSSVMAMFNVLLWGAAQTAQFVELDAEWVMKILVGLWGDLERGAER